MTGPRIRPALPTDAPALSHICLETAAVGKSAAAQHAFPELPGLLYAVPYVELPVAAATTCGVVLEHGTVVGYILCARDTRAFEAAAADAWWPAQRARFPLVHHPGATPADSRYIAQLHEPARASDAVLAVFPTHMHIDILPAYQRQGWGRALLRELVRHLRGEGLAGLYVGIDPANAGARTFYERLSFTRIVPEEEGEHWALKFDDLSDP